jgi:hypothetical protein
MPRVLALRRDRDRDRDERSTETDGDGAAAPQEIEWVEWPDEPRHELLFDVPEPGAPPEPGGQQHPLLAARAYAAFFERGAERFTLFHRHRHDTAYICASAAADDAPDAEVWNEELRALAPPPDACPPLSSPEAAAAEGEDKDEAAPAPTHELLAPSRVHHTTGMCFCNPHGTRDGGAYIHRLRYAASNPRSLHFVGVEVRPRPGAGAVAAGAASPALPLPQVPAPQLFLKLEYEQPGLFRAWRVVMAGGTAAGAATADRGAPAMAETATETAAALGAGFAGRGGAVVLIKAVDWSKIAYECGGSTSAGPFGEAARARARAAGGWSGGCVFPAGAAWPVSPEDGRACFSLALKEDGAVFEAMLVEFL